MNSTSTIPAAFIPATLHEKISVVEITNDLCSMYGPIGCGIVERVALNPHYKACLWVDEEAVCKSAPLNIRASCLLGRPIYGNAIMAGEDAEGNIAPLSLSCPKKFFQLLEDEAVNFILEIMRNAKN
jgi:hypothetical protein